jgi:hypothetical protein
MILAQLARGGAHLSLHHNHQRLKLEPSQLLCYMYEIGTMVLLGCVCGRLLKVFPLESLSAFAKVVMEETFLHQRICENDYGQAPVF